jgi:hypothetical protein
MSAKQFGGAYFLVKPGMCPIQNVVSKHKIVNKKEYNALLLKAKKKNLYVYYAEVKKRGDKHIVNHLVFDWESLPKDTDPKPVVWPSGDKRTVVKEEVDLVCEECEKEFSSKSGYTLHMKSKHPNLLEDR